jgi:hypothetical protein
MKSYFVKMLAALAFLLLFSTKFVDVTIGEQLYEHPLETAWKATGLPLSEVSTETWMQLNERWTPLQELKNLAERIKQRLELRSRGVSLSGEQPEFSYITFEGLRRDNTAVTVTIQSTRTDQLCETQIGVSTINDGMIQNLRDYLAGLRPAITGLGRAAKFTVMLEGERKGKLASNLVRDFSGRAFRRIKAKVIDSAFQDGNLVQKGYTDLIRETVQLNSKPYNVELNTRYDRGRDRTEIVLGSPNLTDGV